MTETAAAPLTTPFEYGETMVISVNVSNFDAAVEWYGKAQCVTCHSGPALTDDYMHDLQVERFYVGRPEGPIKTFPLRGIKDSPPYLHDGRAKTLEEAITMHGGQGTRAEVVFPA